MAWKDWLGLISPHLDDNSTWQDWVGTVLNPATALIGGGYQFGQELGSSIADVVGLSSDPMEDVNSDMSDLTDPGETIFNNNQLDQNAADVANDKTEDWLNKVMEYNARQAELSRVFQQTSADKAMEYSAQQAEIAYQRQLEMQSTAWQRTMEDMRKAGINPKLVAKLGTTAYPTTMMGQGYNASGSVASVQSTSSHKAQTDMQTMRDLIIEQIRSATDMTQSELSALTDIVDSILGMFRFQVGFSI